MVSRDHVVSEVLTQYEHSPLVIGIDLGGTQIRTAVMRGPRLLSRVGLPTSEQTGPENVIARMIQAVYQAMDQAGIVLEQVEGIGIGAPGPINAKTGVVSNPPNLSGWQDVRLRDIFYEHFQCPIYVENDANAAALGEFMFGAGKGCSDVAYLTISTGIGGGIIANGQLLSGSVGTAAELGHMTIDMYGPRCNCGNIGCLESLASGTAIARRANELIALRHNGSEALRDFALKLQSRKIFDGAPYNIQNKNNMINNINARVVAEAAASGIPLAREIIQSAAEALGVGLVNILHIFNPEIIILGGGVTQIGEPLLGPAQRIVHERSMRIAREKARIVLATLGDDVGLIGAGALIYQHQKATSIAVS
jgi:glucokinase